MIKIKKKLQFIFIQQLHISINMVIINKINTIWIITLCTISFIKKLEFICVIQYNYWNVYLLNNNKITVYILFESKLTQEYLTQKKLYIVNIKKNEMHHLLLIAVKNTN